MKMTKTSKENILIADKIRIEKNLYNDTYFVFLMLKDRSAYVCSKDAPVEYPTANHARLAVHRIRKDIAITTL